jgi:tetratricopeptide (TPR) repeat protein
MKNSTFEKILTQWKLSEEKRMKDIRLPKTKQCLSFNQFRTGIFNSDEMIHLKKCDYCSKMRELFFRYEDDEYIQADNLLEQPSVSVLRLAWDKSSLVVKAFFDKIANKLGRSIFPLPNPLKIALGTAIIIFLIIGVFNEAEPKLSDLAQIEPHYFQSLNIRDGALVSESEQLFERATIFYNQENYQQAINKLLEANQLQPNDANINFYLGICYLLTDKLNLAIQQFNIVINSQNVQFVEMSYWYLGNVYLLKEEGKQALNMFQKVVDMERDYEWEAKEMIEKIQFILNQT